MPEWEETALIYGGEHLGKGVQRALVEVDRMVPAGFMGMPISEIVNIGAGVAIPVVLNYVWRPKAPWDKVLLLLGGYLSTSVWDYAEQATMSYTPVPRGQPQGYYPGVYTQAAMAPSPPITKAKYVVTG